MTQIYGVRGRFENYDDHREWPVRAFKSAEKAEAFRAALEQAQTEASTETSTQRDQSGEQTPPPAWAHPLDPEYKANRIYRYYSAEYLVEVSELED